MSTRILSGTPYKRNPDPNVNNGSASPEGLYPWSAFRAQLTEIDANEVIASTITDGASLELLVFSSDIPAVGLLLCTTSTAQILNTTLNLITYTGANPILATSSGGSTSASGADFGSVLSGYSGAGRLVPDVSGFAAIAPLPQTPGGTNCEDNALLVWANSAILNAPVGPNLFSAADQGTTSPVRVASPTPILLLVDNYTAAIRNAGNLITDTNGYLYQVVGLWKVFVGR